MLHYADTLTIGAKRRTKDGYLAVRARAARAGIYDYLGREIDPEAKHFKADQLVKVYRPPEEVFAKDSVASFLMKPVTNDHPGEPVTADNWAQYAKGAIGRAMRDGDFLAFDLVLMDKAAIDAVDSGKRELSNGYASELEFVDGTTPDGEPFQAIQRNIRGNHVALVDAGRAGPFCKIIDCADCGCIPSGEDAEIIRDGETYSAEDFDDKNSADAISPVGAILMATKQITFDGMPIEATDQSEAAIRKLEGQVATLTTAKDAAETKVAELTGQVSTKDGEIAALNQKVTDSALKPEQIEKLVADRAALIAQAQAIDPKVVTDGKTEAEIRSAIVSAKLGDAAAGLDEAGIVGAFTVLAKDAKPIDPVRNALSGGVVSVGDAKADYQASRDKARTNLSNAWRGPPPAVAANAA